MKYYCVEQPDGELTYHDTWDEVSKLFDSVPVYSRLYTIRDAVIVTVRIKRVESKHSTWEDVPINRFKHLNS